MSAKEQLVKTDCTYVIILYEEEENVRDLPDLLLRHDDFEISEDK